jgi:hypothetical protein
VNDNAAGAAIRSIAFTRGELRGTQLTLFPGSLVHRSDSHLETLPLAAITAVRVAFERNARRLGWGVTLLLVALVLLAITGPVGTFASSAAASQQSIPAMYTIYRAIEAVASMMPVAALACVIGGGLLCAFGWLGRTTLSISLPGSERVYAARGRNSELLDFAEALSERLMLVRR